MLTSGYIVMTLLVVYTVVDSGQSSLVQSIANVGNITIGKHIGSAIKYDTEIKVEIKCIEGQPGYDCCLKIKDNAVKCIEGKLRVPTEEEIKDMTADDLTKYSCCMATIMTDCIVDNAKDSCSADDYKLYKQEIDQGIEVANKGDCANHKIVPGQIGYCSGTVTLLANIALIMISFVSVKLYLN
ncbi:uncharacterized protein LOC128958454 [Oppia nitens]|uniref:uncharacterized protein LOC128958454 n=1 Tax=Oppia nitens TaxID=1686743 RepID=UPI0023DC975D|nr:uncharacterized protein LOC128958454 [Oppia nitens]